MEFAQVAITYNTGSYKPSRGLRQGHFDGEKYYGEYIHEYVTLSRTVSTKQSTAPGRYSVAARSGLKLRGGPGTQFDVLQVLPTGTLLYVLKTAENPAWVLVDLEGDGLRDGFVFGSFLVLADSVPPLEDHNEPS